MMHKLLNNKAPECLTETFAPLRDGSIYNLRGSDHNVTLPKLNTEYFEKRFFFIVVQNYQCNSLPTNLKTAHFVTSFRRSLRTFSLQKLSS